MYTGFWNSVLRAQDRWGFFLALTILEPTLCAPNVAAFTLGVLLVD